MHFPTVHERVWIRGCTHEFVVIHTDYAARIATVSAIELTNEVRRCPFRVLFSHEDFEESRSNASLPEDALKILDTSRLNARISNVAIREMRETAAATRSMAGKTRELLAQTDLVVARWSRLGCMP